MKETEKERGGTRVSTLDGPIATAIRENPVQPSEGSPLSLRVNSWPLSGHWVFRREEMVPQQPPEVNAGTGSRGTKPGLPDSCCSSFQIQVLNFKWENHNNGHQVLNVALKG